MGKEASERCDLGFHRLPGDQNLERLMWKEGFMSERLMRRERAMIGWRMHLGVIWPTPIQGWIFQEFYDVVPEGIDITVYTLTTQQLSIEDMEGSLAGIERAAERLKSFEVDLIYFMGIPLLTLKGAGYDRVVIDRIQKASGLPASTGITGVMQAFKKLKLQRLIMATPFEDQVNQRIKDFFKPEGFEIVHMKGLQIRRNVEFRKLPVPIQYQFTREVFRESPVEPDGIYIPCQGWGSIHNIQPLENDLGKPVITGLNAMIWYTMQMMGIQAPVQGFGKLLETL